MQESVMIRTPNVNPDWSTFDDGSLRDWCVDRVVTARHMKYFRFGFNEMLIAFPSIRNRTRTPGEFVAATAYVGAPFERNRLCSGSVFVCDFHQSAGSKGLTQQTLPAKMRRSGTDDTTVQSAKASWHLTPKPTTAATTKARGTARATPTPRPEQQSHKNNQDSFWEGSFTSSACKAKQKQAYHQTVQKEGSKRTNEKARNNSDHELST